LKSMTGYGRADGTVAGREVTVEVRCYNHRFKDVRVKLPRGWTALEVPVESLARSWMGRGRVECMVRAASGASGVGKPSLDRECAREYLQAYKDLAKDMGSGEEPSLALVARSEGVVVFYEDLEDIAKAWEELETLMDRALLAADQMRLNEGRELAREVDVRLAEVDRIRKEVEAEVPNEQMAIAERMSERVRALADKVEVSEDLLSQEIAVLSERMDVTEELARLGSHVTQFGQLIQKDEPVGRELDFLLQEMNREANTLSSKIHSASVVALAVSLKAEIEKIREQIQNVE
jgi:uncharacterized protein (TIGR00255 family)